MGAPRGPTGPSTGRGATPSTGLSVEPNVQSSIDSSPLDDVVVPERPRAAAFPLRVDNDVLTDANGDSFLIGGDAAWSMIAQLDLEQIDDYLDVRARQGFNTIIVNLVEAYFSDDPPRTADGLEPFLTEGDWTTPNPDYFDRAATVLEHAEDRGFLVLLFPAYLGYEGGQEGFFEEMKAQGPQAIREYGAWIGKRFRSHDNIIWVNGGDFEPPFDDLELVQAVADGIRSEDDSHLHTAHWGPESGGSDLDVDFLDLDTTYSWDSVGVLGTSHQLRGGPPRFVIESTYEGDQNGRSDQQIREQGYEAMLTGAIGYVFGNSTVWHFPADWESSLDSVGADGMTHLFALFSQVSPEELVPDTGHTVLVEGAGSIGEWDAAVAASNDGFILVYDPAGRDLTVALPADRRSVAQWFDPTNGTLGDPQLVVPDGSGSVTLRSPGANDAGDPDWVLIVRHDDATATGVPD